MYLSIIAFIFGLVFELVGSSFLLTALPKMIDKATASNTVFDQIMKFKWVDSGSAVLLLVALVLVLVVSVVGIFVSLDLKKSNERTKGIIGLSFSIASIVLSAAFAVFFFIAIITL